MNDSASWRQNIALRDIFYAGTLGEKHIAADSYPEVGKPDTFVVQCLNLDGSVSLKRSARSAEALAQFLQNEHGMKVGATLWDPRVQGAQLWLHGPKSKENSLIAHKLCEEIVSDNARNRRAISPQAK